MAKYANRTASGLTSVSVSASSLLSKRKNDEKVDDDASDKKVKSNETVDTTATATATPIIPCKIFLFYHDIHTLPPIMKRHYNELIASHTDFTITLYDITTGLDFIKKNFNSSITNAFEALQPYAYKSDLLRYCLLYVYGGIYVDLKYLCVNAFNFKQLLCKEYLVAEPVGIQNCLMIVVPHNKLMKRLIDCIVTYVNNRDYCSVATAITGPILISRLYKECYSTATTHIHTELSWTWQGAWPGIHIIKLNGDVILQQYQDYRNELKKYSKQPHYTQLYSERRVYGESNTSVITAYKQL